MNSNQPALSAMAARVSYAGSGSFGAVADGEYREPALLSPKGIDWLPEQGDSVLLLPTPDGALCAGAIEPVSTLAPGELRLSGSGGGYIWLKSDGTVVINGAVFSPAGILTQGGA